MTAASRDTGAASLPDRVAAAVRAALPAPGEGGLALHEPEFRGREWAYLKDCLDTGWVSSAGAYVDRIERDLEAITGVRHAVATSNGTAALDVCLRLAGVVAGDEVLVPTLTVVATATAVAYQGATPHFVDSEAETLGVDPVRLDAHLRETARLDGDICVNTRTGAWGTITGWDTGALAVHGDALYFGTEDGRVALADTVYAPAGDAWEEEDDAAIEAEFDLGMRALVVGALAMRP